MTEVMIAIALLLFSSVALGQGYACQHDYTSVDPDTCYECGKFALAEERSACSDGGRAFRENANGENLNEWEDGPGCPDGYKCVPDDYGSACHTDRDYNLAPSWTYELPCEWTTRGVWRDTGETAQVRGAPHHVCAWDWDSPAPANTDALAAIREVEPQCVYSPAMQAARKLSDIRGWTPSGPVYYLDGAFYQNAPRGSDSCKGC